MSIMVKIKSLIIDFLYKNKIKHGENLTILGGLPFFKIPKNGFIEIGDNVIINSDFKNSNTALTYKSKFVTGYDGLIEIGDNAMINGSCIVSYLKVSIGSNCQIASSSIISDTDFHPVDPKIRLKQVRGEPFSFEDVKKEEIIIGNNVWIGWNTIILKGVKIGDNSVVAAGSVVLKGSYPNNVILAGNPAKVVKEI